jgi:AcrR family transcriptional regulator
VTYVSDRKQLDEERAAGWPAGVNHGRPRDASRDVVILDTALRLLVEVGYDQLSIELVAAEAGVGKSTIYRRFSGKAALVAAAVDRRRAQTPPDVRADDSRDALLATLRWLARQIAEQELGLLDATFAGMRNDPELAAQMRRIRHRDQSAMTSNLSPETAELFVELAPALIVYRLLVLGEPCDQRFLEHLADDILLPLIPRSPRTATGPARPASPPAEDRSPATTKDMT